MAVESNPNTLLATQIIKTHVSSLMQEGKEIKGCLLNLSQASTAPSRNFKSKQSLVLSRVPDNGESTSIALFEFHGRALTIAATIGDEGEDDWGSGTTAIIFFLMFGFMVYIMVQKNVDKKKAHKQKQF